MVKISPNKKFHLDIYFIQGSRRLTGIRWGGKVVYFFMLQNPLFVVEKLISYEVINTLMNSSDRGRQSCPWQCSTQWVWSHELMFNSYIGLLVKILNEFFPHQLGDYAAQRFVHTPLVSWNAHSEPHKRINSYDLLLLLLILRLCKVWFSNSLFMCQRGQKRNQGRKFYLF